MTRGTSEYILDPRGLNVSGVLENLTKRCGAALEAKYPGWMWLLNPDEEAGVMYFYSLRLSGEWGYILKIEDVQAGDAEKMAVMAGGEILERYNIRRGRYDVELLRGKITDLRGNYMPDITDRLSKDQKKQRDKDFTKAVEEGKAEVVHRDTVKEDGTVFREIAVRIGDSK